MGPTSLAAQESASFPRFRSRGGEGSSFRESDPPTPHIAIMTVGLAQSIYGGGGGRSEIFLFVVDDITRLEVQSRHRHSLRT